MLALLNCLPQFFIHFKLELLHNSQLQITFQMGAVTSRFCCTIALKRQLKK